MISRANSLALVVGILFFQPKTGVWSLITFKLAMRSCELGGGWEHPNLPFETIAYITLELLSESDRSESLKMSITASWSARATSDMYKYKESYFLDCPSL